MATIVVMISYKNFIYVISTLSSGILSKMNYLAQMVHVSEILHHFPIYPTHLRSVYDPSRLILLFYIGKCPICSMQNISQISPVVLKKKLSEWFLPYMELMAILNFRSSPIFAKFCITII